MAERSDRSPTISVIIPVYEVEDYVSSCIESVLAQSYSNLEIILVDDGSPDSCPDICDSYAVRDARVRVIHKDNGGLSSARNAGLDAVTGEYIGFVDSDDEVDSDMYRLLLERALSGSDIVACNYTLFSDTQEDVYTHGVPDPMTLSRAEAIELLVGDTELQNYAWNKLYAAHLWEDVRFPVGHNYEDVHTTYRVFEKANRITIIPDALYRYRIRKNGIVHSRSLKSEIDCAEAHLQRYRALRDSYPQIEGEMADGVLRALVNVWPFVWEQRGELDPSLQERLAELAAFARRHSGKSGLSSRLGMTGRMILGLSHHARAWAWGISWLLYQAYLVRHPEWKG